MKKEYKDYSLEIKKEDIKEDGTFQGYGSLTDNVPDGVRDIVAPGAFRETLRMQGRNRNGIPMLWQHNSSKIPGVWSSMIEDQAGLKVEGKLALKTTLGSDIYEIMRMGAELGTFQLGMSIGYDAKEVEYDQENRTRTIKRLELWELSIVTFPCKLGAGVDTVKSIEDAKNIREIENALRESGHTKSEALQIIKVIKQSLRESEIKEKEKEAERKKAEEDLRESEILQAGLNDILGTLKSFNTTNTQNTENEFKGILNQI
jgi:HK97 family phage prohead protease